MHMYKQMQSQIVFVFVHKLSRAQSLGQIGWGVRGGKGRSSKAYKI